MVLKRKRRLRAPIRRLRAPIRRLRRLRPVVGGRRRVYKKRVYRRRGGAVSAPSLLSRARNFLRKNKLVSRGLSGLSSALGSHRLAPLAGSLSGLAGSYGYGRKRKYKRTKRTTRKRTTRRRRGAGFFGSLFGKIKDVFSKPSRILGALSTIPTPLSTPLRLAGIASGLAGRGRRRGRKSIRTRRYGRGLLTGRVGSMQNFNSPIAYL